MTAFPIIFVERLTEVVESNGVVFVSGPTTRTISNGISIGLKPNEIAIADSSKADQHRRQDQFLLKYQRDRYSARNDFGLVAMFSEQCRCFGKICWFKKFDSIHKLFISLRGAIFTTKQ